ncbi:hypothetical protein [Pseudomonas mandelii]|uniref:Uncharacterized protein n=1 Tax=Pseudomonas mandelii TaxID=75612 RepID=A0A502HJB3_9PSED|nr:hypothetical protein [Pseudomonas mandelii]TPG73743.1 hypothetical protein EAH74_32760 [Pseudomonas mandelii]
MTPIAYADEYGGLVPLIRSVLTTVSVPECVKTSDWVFYHRRQETVLTFRKLIKVTTLSGTVKTAQQPFKVIWKG